MTTKRERFIAEAHAWLDTPWDHMQCVKGRGVDCAMLLVACAKAAELIASDYVPEPYPMQWYLHQGEERFLNEVRKFCDPTDHPIPGDVIVGKVGRLYAHGAIMVSPTHVIHAVRRARKVKLDALAVYLSHPLTYWSLRDAGR